MKTTESANIRAPSRAGDAEIHMDGEWPMREGNRIVLPRDRYCVYRPLCAGRKFVYAFTPDGNGSSFWFGGTDERTVFLTRISREAYESSENEVCFFDFLKPCVVHRCEKRFGMPSKRQGDIFAVPLPYSITQVANIVEVFDGYGVVKKGVRDVYHTRHFFAGHMVDVEIPGDGRLMVVKGVLKAPDHRPLTLDVPHLLVQSRGLFNSRGAD